MSKEKKAQKKIGNVQVVTTNTQNQSVETATKDIPEDKTEETHVQAMPFDLSKVDPEKIKLAEEMGIPISQLVAWANSVEARFRIIEEEMPKKTAEALMQIAEKRRQEMIAQGQRNPQMAQGMGGLMQLAPLLQVLGGSGGGSNPLMEKFVNAAVDKAMVGMDLSNAFMRAMIVKLSPELADAVTKDVVKK